MKFNKDKCKSLFLGRESPLPRYRLGNDNWGAALQKTVLGTLVGSEMSMRKQCPGRKKANSLPDYLNRSRASTLRKGIILLLSTL